MLGDLWSVVGFLSATLQEQALCTPFQQFVRSSVREFESSLKPAPGSKIHGRKPLIVAKVSDTETDLAQGNIKLFVNSKAITNFSYDAATDQLSYQSGRLASGEHTVKVEATDASGLKGENTWTFEVKKVVRR